jgi:glycosyltransferase involved in cell wall biosynthesis
MSESSTLPAGELQDGCASARDVLAAGVMAWPAFRSENPYNVMLYEAVTESGVRVDDFSPWKLLTSPPSIFHVHWPEIVINVPNSVRAALRGIAFLSLIWAARLRGTKVVWTVHNLHPHELPHPRLQRWLWRGLLPLVDGYVSLTAGGAQAARETFPPLCRLPGFVIPHGHFRRAYSNHVSFEEARCRLGIPLGSTVFGFLGRIRPYKNVPHLVQTFRALQDPEARLLIAGQPESAAIRAEVAEAAAGDLRVHLSLDHVPNDAVQLYLKACDLVVLPFTEILNSGSAMLALSFDRPVLVPLTGAMGELQSTAGPEWVRTFSGSLTPPELESAGRWARAAQRGHCSSIDRLGWEHAGQLTTEAYCQLAASEAL